MPSPIYMPKDTRLEAIGGALGSAFETYQNKQELAKIQKIQKDIIQAPNRAEADKIFMSMEFKTPEQLKAGYDWLETVHPKIKPSVKEFYMPNEAGAYTNVGKALLEQRPAGSLTADELEKQFKAREDQRAAAAAQLAQERFDFEVSKAGASSGNDKASKELTQLKAFNNVVASMLNIKKSIGQTGEIILDFGGDSRVADAYRTALDKGADYLKKFNGDVNKAANAALKESGAYDRPAEDATPTAPAAPEGGAVTNFIRNLFSASPSKQADKPAAQTSQEPKAAPPAAVAYLKSNNTTANRTAFKAKYGYLPK